MARVPALGTTGAYDCPTIVSPGPIFGDVTSLVINDIGSSYLPNVLYYNTLDYHLYFYHEGGSEAWISHTVDASHEIGETNSLEVDTNGPHLSYYEAYHPGLRYAELDIPDHGGCGEYGASAYYRCETVEGYSDVGWYSSVGIGIGGHPRIAYYDNDDHDLRYATLDTTWSSIVIDDAFPDVGKYASLAFSPSTGLARIAYMDSTNGWLRYAEELPPPYTGGICGPGGTWKCVDVDQAGAGGAGVSLDIDPYGTAYISYIDATDQLVKVASFVGSGGSCSNPFWQCDTITEATHYTVDGETSISADFSNGVVMVSFYNTGAATLMYASFNLGGGWSHEVVDFGDYVGKENSLTVIGTTPVIAYLDELNFDLKLATRVGFGTGNCGENDHWYCETLDSIGHVGSHPSISNNSNGLLYISYYDSTNGDLKLAFQALPTFMPLVKKP